MLRDLGIYEGLAFRPEGSPKPRSHTHGPLSSSFLGLPERILNINQKKGAT